VKAPNRGFLFELAVWGEVMKSIAFQWQGQTVTGSLGTKITKQALYGYAKRIVEKDAQVLKKGYLSPEGQILER